MQTHNRCTYSVYRHVIFLFIKNVTALKITVCGPLIRIGPLWFGPLVSWTHPVITKDLQPCGIKANKKLLPGSIVAVANAEENHRYALEVIIHASVELTVNFGHD